MEINGKSRFRSKTCLCRLKIGGIKVEGPRNDNGSHD